MWQASSRAQLRRATFALACLLLASPAPASAAQADLPQVIARILPSVVTVEATTIATAGPAGGAPAHTTRQVGAGFIVDPDGTIVTNLHVIAGTDEILVTLQDGTELVAAPGARNASADLALLTVHTARPLAAVRFGDSSRLRVGDPVIAIGAPYGLSDTVSTGIVSALNRNIAETDYDDYIQTDAAINHGNSGGPLFNRQGEVIGINSVIFAPAGSGGSIGLGFAMPSNDLRFVIGQLRRFGYLRLGFLGAAFQDVTPQLAQGLGAGKGRVVITRVAADTPAARAGLQPGDVIERFGDATVSDSRALARAIAKAPIGQAVDVTAWRQGQALRLAASVVAAPRGAPAAMAAPAPVAAAGLGLTVRPLTEDARRVAAAAPGQIGVLVTQVASRHAAAMAGLHAGDIIVMAQHRSIEDPDMLRRALDDASRAGDSFAALLVLRHGELHWVALALAQHQQRGMQ